MTTTLITGALAEGGRPANHARSMAGAMRSTEWMIDKALTNRQR